MKIIFSRKRTINKHSVKATGSPKSYSTSVASTFSYFGFSVKNWRFTYFTAPVPRNLSGFWDRKTIVTSFTNLGIFSKTCGFDRILKETYRKKKESNNSVFSAVIVAVTSTAYY